MNSFFQKKILFSPSYFTFGAFFLVAPFLLIVTHFMIEQNQMLTLSNRVLLLEQHQKKKESQLKKEQNLYKQISSSSPNYLKNTLESMMFLGKERQKWQLFASQVEPSHPMKERVSFLESGKNCLQFVQQEMHKNNQFQETEETQKNTIEVSEDDLKVLLSHIENPHVSGAPQLLIKSFELEKKTVPGIKEKTYQVQIGLIKREHVSKE